MVYCIHEWFDIYIYVYDLASHILIINHFLYLFKKVYFMVHVIFIFSFLICFFKSVCFIRKALPTFFKAQHCNSFLTAPSMWFDHLLFVQKSSSVCVSLPLIFYCI